jgi:ribulose-5-phosphate 4-epimerase/fuculose-1-phosphate aldolase
MNDLKEPVPPVFSNPQDERLHRRQRLAAALRLFARYGYDEGVVGHLTARDPILTDHYWVNPYGIYFGQIGVSDLVLVSPEGKVVQGSYPANPSAHAIHFQILRARPDLVASFHTHSLYGRAWSSLGRLLDPITQDACVFYQDHALFDDYQGRVLKAGEGELIAAALGSRKALILRNHGFLTVGGTVDEAAWWFITMEHAAQAQFLAESIGKPIPVRHDSALQAYSHRGTPQAGWLAFQPLYQKIVREEPDLLK